MTVPSLRAILEAAENDIDTYREPDIGEAVSRLSDILVAGGYSRLSAHEVTVLRIYPETVHVRIEYSAKGCDCDHTYEFPTSIIDAEDPIKAAARWALERKHADATRRLEEAERHRKHWATTVADIEAQMAAA